jgi:hypothetical protein
MSKVVDMRQPDRKAWLDEQIALEAAARGPVTQPEVVAPKLVARRQGEPLWLEPPPATGEAAVIAALVNLGPPKGDR